MADQIRVDPVAALAAVFGGAAVVLLAPLMLDQFVLFADQDQSRQAAESRIAMAPLAAVVLAAAGVSLVRRRVWHALFGALPALVAVSLAWLVPDTLYQLLAYAITAPIALGVLLASAMPLPERLSGWALVVSMVVLGVIAVVTTPMIAILFGLAGLVWWRMPPTGPPDLIGPDWR